MYRLGEKMFYFRGGPHDFGCVTCHGDDDKRIRLQDLPNLHQGRRRAEGVHDLAGVPRVAGRAAHVPVAAQRLLPPAALSGARVRLGCVDRADDVPRRATPTAPRSTRRRSSAERRRRHARRLRRTSSPAPCCRGARRAASAARRAPADAEVTARGGGDDEGVVQGARPGEARPPRPGRDAAPLQRVRGQAAAEGRRRDASRRRISRRSSIRPTASSSATGRTARRSRRKRRRHAVFRRSEGPGRRNCYACHQLAPQELSYGTIGPVLYQFGKLRGYTDEIAQVRVRQGLQRRGVRRVLQHAALRAQRHPDRAADQGRRRAADGSRVAGQPVTVVAERDRHREVRRLTMRR